MEGRAGWGGVGNVSGRNEVVLTVCSQPRGTHAPPSRNVCFGAEGVEDGEEGGGGGECSSTETLVFLVSWFPKVTQVLNL